MPLTIRSKQVTDLLPVVRAGVRAAHLRSAYADDAVQQTLVAIMPHLDRLSAMTVKERRAYVFVAASRTAMACRKRLGLVEARGTDADVAEWAERNGVAFSPELSPEQQLQGAQRAARAQRALDAMGTRDRNLIEAVVDEGLSEREIADQLGVSRGGVAYRLRKAREILGHAWHGTTSWARRRSGAIPTS